MTTLEKIKAEIQKVLDVEGDSESAKAQAFALFWVLELIDKYAEQEPCDDVVSRQTVLDEFHDLTNLYERIKQLPSVQPKQECEDAVSRQIDDIREETYKRAVLNCMGMIDAIREEIANLTCDCINGMVNQYAVLQIIDKYTKGGAE